MYSGYLFIAIGMKKMHEICEKHVNEVFNLIFW